MRIVFWDTKGGKNTDFLGFYSCVLTQGGRYLRVADERIPYSEGPLQEEEVRSRLDGSRGQLEGVKLTGEALGVRFDNLVRPIDFYVSKFLDESTRPANLKVTCFVIGSEGESHFFLVTA